MSLKGVSPRNAALKTLDLGANASAQEIKVAYRAAIIKAHPDKGGTKEAAQAVIAAYEYLTNSKSSSPGPKEMTGKELANPTMTGEQVKIYIPVVILKHDDFGMESASTSKNHQADLQTMEGIFKRAAQFINDSKKWFDDTSYLVGVTFEEAVELFNKDWTIPKHGQLDVRVAEISIDLKDLSVGRIKKTNRCGNLSAQEYFYLGKDIQIQHSQILSFTSAVDCVSLSNNYVRTSADHPVRTLKLARALALAPLPKAPLAIEGSQAQPAAPSLLISFSNFIYQRTMTALGYNESCLQELDKPAEPEKKRHKRK